MLVAVLNEFGNVHFQIFVIQSVEIHIFTRVHKEYCIVFFSQIFGCSNHGMLSRRPLAAQVSYLLIYLNNASLGVPG